MPPREFRTDDGRMKFTLEVDGSIYGGRPIHYEQATYEVLWPPVQARQASVTDRPIAYRVRLLDELD